MASTNVEGRIRYSPIEATLPRTPVLTLKQYNWGFTLAALLFNIGMWLDTWAHSHLPDELESFFTPWHAVLYTGATSMILFVGIVALLNRRRGLSGWDLVPKGYELTVFGFVIFSVAGFLDMLWHTFLGIEVDLEAVISPPHLLLMVGATHMLTGPIRSAWKSNKRHLSSPLPIILSWAITMFSIALLTFYANPVARLHALINTPQTHEMGFSGVIVWTALFMTFTLLLIRRWHLPFGSITLLWVVASFGITVMEDTYVMLIFIFITGLIADFINQLLKPHYGKEIHIRLFAFTVPIIYYIGYFTTILFTYQSLSWPIPMWAGTIFIAGAVGFGGSYLIWQPRMPQKLGLER